MNTILIIDIIETVKRKNKKINSQKHYGVIWRKQLRTRRKIMNREKSIEKFKSLNLSNDFLAGQAFGDKAISKKLVELVLNHEIPEISRIDIQKTIDDTFLKKGVRLDVYFEEEYNGCIYNIEMQNKDEKNIINRMDYYTSNLKTHSLDKGNNYINLRKSCVIFITTFDIKKSGVFEDNLYVYKLFRAYSNGEKIIPLKNEPTSQIILNTRGTEGFIGKELKEFLEYVENSTDEQVGKSTTQFVKDIHRKVTEIKNNESLEELFMTLEEKFFENREEGHNNCLIKIY